MGCSRAVQGFVYRGRGAAIWDVQRAVYWKRDVKIFFAAVSNPQLNKSCRIRTGKFCRGNEWWRCCCCEWTNNCCALCRSVRDISGHRRTPTCRALVGARAELWSQAQKCPGLQHEAAGAVTAACFVMQLEESKSSEDDSFNPKTSFQPTQPTVQQLKQ